MKNLLLINLNSYPPIFCGEVYPIGLNKIASFLRQRGYSCDIMDRYKDGDLDITCIDWKNYSAVGLTIRNIDTLEMDSKLHYSMYCEIINKIYHYAKSQNPAITIVVGGTGYSLYYQKLHTLLQYDYGIVGDGEYAFLSILEHSASPSEQILIARKSVTERIVYDEALVKAYLAKNEKAAIGVQTYHGRCSSCCVYCNYGFNCNDKPLYKSIPDLLAEMKQLTDLGVFNIFIVDSLFNRSDAYACRLLEAIAEEEFHCELTLFLNPSHEERLYQLLKKCHVKPIYSFDSFSPKMLKLLNKGFNLEDICTTMELCNAYQIPFTVTLLFGMSGESEQTVRETCEFMNHLFTSHVTVPKAISLGFGIRLVPNSSLFEAMVSPEDNYLEPTFCYFDQRIFDYVYQYLDPSYFTINRVAKHMNLKICYSTAKFSRKQTRSEKYAGGHQ